VRTACLVLCSLVLGFAPGSLPAASAAVEAGPLVNPANQHHYYLLGFATWAAAEAEAVSLGGHLVTIEDAAENAWVWQTFSAIAPGQSFWIGLNDEAQEGSFVWTSGAPVSYTNWWTANGEPNNLGGIEHYVELKNTVWNDNNGSMQFRAVVEMPAFALAPGDILTGGGPTGQDLVRIDPAPLPAQVTTLASFAGRVADVAVEPDGRLAIAIEAAGTIDLHRFDPVTGTVTPLFAAVPGDGPSVAVEPDGHLLFTDGDTVARLDANGSQLGATVMPCLISGGSMSGLAIGSQGEPYFASNDCPFVFRVDTLASVSPLIGSPGPGDVAFVSATQLLAFVPAQGIASVDPTQMTMTTVRPTLDAPVFLAHDPFASGYGSLLVHRRNVLGSNEVAAIDLAAGSEIVLASGVTGGLPGGVAVVLPACADRLDNDGDGLVDHPADPDCAASAANREAPLPACADGISNDADGLVDFPADPGCTSAADVSETQSSLACDNGSDDDGDGLADHAVAAGAGDPGCGGPTYAREDPACQNGLDDDNQAGIDFDGGASLHGGTPIAPPDPDCLGKPWQNYEAPACGLGGEAALLLPLLAWWRRRRA
jgi:hypothetical protein